MTPCTRKGDIGGDNDPLACVHSIERVMKKCVIGMAKDAYPRARRARFDSFEGRVLCGLIFS